jgi:hypothetical protein
MPIIFIKLSGVKELHKNYKILAHHIGPAGWVHFKGRVNSFYRCKESLYYLLFYIKNISQLAATIEATILLQGAVE